jgi:hypothetical protein
VSVAKFFDSEGMLESAKQDPYLKAYFWLINSYYKEINE